MMTHPEDTDDHKRCRVGDKLRQHLPQEATHLLRGSEVGGHIDGQNEQRYGDGEDAIGEADDTVADVLANLVGVVCKAGVSLIVHSTTVYCHLLREAYLVEFRERLSEKQLMR